MQHSHSHHYAYSHHCQSEHRHIEALTFPNHKIRRLGTALVLIGGLSIAELAVGYRGHSLALVAEAGHMVADGLAMGLALVAAWLAQRPNHHTSRLRQIEPIAALVNGIGLVILAVWIGWEAIDRLAVPPTEIASIPMLVTASCGFVINSINISLLHQDSHHDLNLRGAFLHVLADTLSSIGVILAAMAIAIFNWLWADGAISLIVAGLILFSALPLIRASLQALFNSYRSLTSSH